MYNDFRNELFLRAYECDNTFYNQDDINKFIYLLKERSIVHQVARTLHNILVRRQVLLTV